MFDKFFDKNGSPQNVDQVCEDIAYRHIDWGQILKKVKAKEECFDCEMNWLFASIN